MHMSSISGNGCLLYHLYLTLSCCSLLEKAPWKGKGKEEVEGDKFNFLRAAREEQEEKEMEAEKEEEEEKLGEGRKKKQKINVYDFFQEMRNISVRPLSIT